MRYEFTTKDIKLFWSKVDRSGGPDACWPFLGRIGTGGYGIFSLGKRRSNMKAHRAAYLLANGEIPDDTPNVLHECDNPPCCNERHLFSGTQKDNVDDMIQKGRDKCLTIADGKVRGDRHAARARPDYLKLGESHPMSKMTEDAVRKLRNRHAAGESGAALARAFGITKTQAWSIINRKHWKHVP